MRTPLLLSHKFNNGNAGLISKFLILATVFAPSLRITPDHLIEILLLMLLIACLKGVMDNIKRPHLIVTTTGRYSVGV